MRFITEFEIRKEETKPEIVIQYRKERGENGLGYLLAKSFGWENPVNENKLHHRLEIEAFPMDKWAKFRAILVDELWSTRPNHGNIINALKELESFSKPSRDAKQSSIL